IHLVLIPSLFPYTTLFLSWSIIGSIIGLPSYIDPEAGINSNFWYAVMITILTLVISFLITYFWGYNDDMKMEQKREKPKNPEIRSEEHTSELQSRFDLVCR